MVLATWWGWGNAASIAPRDRSCLLLRLRADARSAYLRAGVPPRRALSLAFASDTASITVMEITDNAFILLVPGAIDAGLGQALFWWSLAVSLLVAFVVAFPLNRWLISRGRGHAVIHEYHGHSSLPAPESESSLRAGRVAAPGRRLAARPLRREPAPTRTYGVTSCCASGWRLSPSAIHPFEWADCGRVRTPASRCSDHYRGDGTGRQRQLSIARMPTAGTRRGDGAVDQRDVRPAAQLCEAAQVRALQSENFHARRGSVDALQIWTRR